jgi:hypothetical protein
LRQPALPFDIRDLAPSAEIACPRRSKKRSCTVPRVRVGAGPTCGPAIVTRNAVMMTMLQLVAAIPGTNLRRI